MSKMLELKCVATAANENSVSVARTICHLQVCVSVVVDW